MTRGKRRPQAGSNRSAKSVVQLVVGRELDEEEKLSDTPLSLEVHDEAVRDLG